MPAVSKNAHISQRRTRQFLLKICAETSILNEMQQGSITLSTISTIARIAEAGPKGSPHIVELQDLLAILPQLPEGEARTIYLEYRQHRKQERNLLNDTRRKFRKNLGLGNGARTAAQLCHQGVSSLIRERIYEPIPKGTYLNEPRTKKLVVKPSTSNPKTSPEYQVIGNRAEWRRVHPDESVIITNSKGDIELVVLRHLTNNAALLESVNTVVSEAIKDRNGTRPNHDGDLVQAGYNAGARHIHPRIFGLVNNFSRKKSVSDSEKKDKDLRVIGIFSLFWHLIRAHAPAEIVNHVQTKLDDSGLPEMAGRYSEGTSGYEFAIGGQTLRFPNVKRAPSEGYLASNYTSPVHTDKCWTDFAFAWQTQHTRPSKSGATGGNFVDVTLRVIVDSSSDTLLIFKPNYWHATTLSHPKVLRLGIVISSSVHIKEAFDRAMQKLKNNESPVE